MVRVDFLIVEPFSLFLFTQLSSHSISEMKITLFFVHTFYRLVTIHCVVEPCRSCGGNFNDCVNYNCCWNENENHLKCSSNRTRTIAMLRTCSSRKIISKERRIEQKCPFISQSTFYFCHKSSIQERKENYKNLSFRINFHKFGQELLERNENETTLKLTKIEDISSFLCSGAFFISFKIQEALNSNSTIRLFIPLEWEASRLLCIFLLRFNIHSKFFLSFHALEESSECKVWGE